MNDSLDSDISSLSTIKLPSLSNNSGLLSSQPQLESPSPPQIIESSKKKTKKNLVIKVKKTTKKTTKKKKLNINDNDNEKKLINEIKTSEEIVLKENEYNYLYPDLNDPNFNIKIARHKEFYDTKYDGKVKPVEKESEILCNADFELAPHQQFVRNFMSFQTPYNSLLLYHGLGTGKTCSAITIAEEMRNYLKQIGELQRILVVASPNVQENFKLQLFDERKLKLIDGQWNIKACTGNKYLKEINPINMKGLTKQEVISSIKQIINNSYLFLGYIEFANYIFKKSKIAEGDKSKSSIIKKKLEKNFNNRLIIIDEIHNIRMDDNNKNKRVAVELLKLVKNVSNLRLLLLSATPMYNSYKEIIWLINLMNINDNRATIEINDVFDKNGNFLISETGEEIGKELLERKCRGYVSFIRGENPYTFPYRVWPKEFSPKNTFEYNKYPRYQLNGREILEGLDVLSVYLNKLGEIQNKGYNYLIEELKNKKKDEKRKNVLPDFDEIESFGYTLLQKPIEALNIVYPYDDDKEIEGSNIVGKGGLNRMMKYVETITPPKKNNFEYRDEKKYGRIFSYNEIGKYSSKIKSICDNILNSDGIILIYSQYIDGGLVPVALALEELGLTREGIGKSLFKDKPKGIYNIKGKYVMITGDKSLSPDNLTEIKKATDENNVNGDKIKVILISQAGSEGIDLKYVRQVHILEPWYNMSRIEQIIGRAVRTCSHKDLPFVKRNVEIFLHGSLMEEEDIEAADLYVYRLAESKAISIGHVTRLLKEVSVDCLLNIGQNNFTREIMNQKVKQELSNKNLIDYEVGDKPYTAICDYMSKCSYTCNPNKEIKDEDVILDTFNESFILMNTDKIIYKIKKLMKDRFFYTKNEIINLLNMNKSYPLVQINAALTQLVSDESEYISDKFGRLGKLINIDDLYVYQPIELNNKNTSIYDKSTPIEYKRINVNFKLPEKIVENIYEPPKITVNVEINEEVKKLINEITKKYNTALQENTLQKKEENWYVYCSFVIKRLANQGVSMIVLKNMLINHILDEIMFDKMIILLNYLYNNTNNEFEENLKNVIESKILTNKKTSGIILQNKDKPVLVIRNKTDDKYVWKIAEPENYIDLGENLKKIVNEFLPANKINEYVGFITNFKNEYMIFKVKNMKKKRHKGARCDQSGRKEAVKVLNDIANIDMSDTDITQKELCVLQELILRLYDLNKKNDKKWFLSPAEVSLINLENINY